MSIVFVVESEDGLRGGIPWCKHIAKRTGQPIHTLVLGADRRVLLEHARKSLAKHLEISADQVSVESIEMDQSAVLDFAHDKACSTLLLMDGPHRGDLQETVFMKSPVRTILMRSSGQIPTETSKVSLAVATDENFLGTVDFVLGFRPSEVFCEESTADATEVGRQVRYGMESHQQADELLLFDIQNPNHDDAALVAGLEILSEPSQASIALVQSGHNLAQSFLAKAKRWAADVAPPMTREERLELSADLEQNSTPNLEFLGLISAAAMLAAFGLLQDSAAVIIGAMLIAPLMTPILGTGLAITHGNRKLFKSALLTIGLGFVGALGSSILFGGLVWLVRPVEADHLNWVTPEMWSRCRPSPLDFCVGLVGGLAAAYARTRQHLSAALAGAAIAAALVPPISTAGLQIAFGIWGNHPQGTAVIGPILLVSVNVLTIIIGASSILWLRGIRGDRAPSTKDKWVIRVIAILILLVLIALVISIRPRPS